MLKEKTQVANEATQDKKKAVNVLKVVDKHHDTQTSGDAVQINANKDDNGAKSSPTTGSNDDGEKEMTENDLLKAAKAIDERNKKERKEQAHAEKIQEILKFHPLPTENEEKILVANKLSFAPTVEELRTFNQEQLDEEKAPFNVESLLKHISRTNAKIPYYRCLNLVELLVNDEKALFNRANRCRAAIVEIIAEELWRKDQHKEPSKQKYNDFEDARLAAKRSKVPMQLILKFLPPLLPLAKIDVENGSIDTAPLYVFDFDKKIYSSELSRINRLIFQLFPESTLKFRKEITEAMRIKTLPHESEKKGIPVKNGVIFKKEDGSIELTPYTPQMFFKTKINTNYNPDAEEPEFNGWRLSSWFKELSGGDEAKERLLYQGLRAAIDPTTSNKVTSALFLLDDGQGRTGKSTYEQLAVNLVGVENVGTLKLNEFSKKFEFASMFDKRLIIGDDNDPNGYISDSANFKGSITGEYIMINPKGEKPFKAKMSTFVIQSMNGIPHIADKTPATLRRITFIKFNKQYPKDEASKAIKLDYINRPELLEWLLKKLVEMPDFSEFAETAENATIKQQFQLDNDPVLSFYQNTFKTLKSTIIPTSWLYDYFRAVEIRSGKAKSKIYSRRKFTLELQRLLTRENISHEVKKARPLDKFVASDNIEAKSVMTKAHLDAEKLWNSEEIIATQSKSTRCLIIK